MADKKVEVSEHFIASDEDIKAAAERTATAKAIEAEEKKAAKEIEGIAVEAAKVAADAEKASLKAGSKTVSVSNGGVGFLVTETKADGSISQYVSETDPTRSNQEITK